MVGIMELPYFNSDMQDLSSDWKYWMYKFRNTSQETVDNKHRNTLQTVFTSWTSIVSSLPVVISVLGSTFYGHKVRTRTRLILSLIVVVGCFAISTAFVSINTDSWQLGFFCLTMLVIVIIHMIMTVFHASAMALLSRFPPRFTTPYLYGEAASGLFSGILQIMALAISPSTETAALIYFFTGTFVIFFILFLVYISKYFKFIQYYLHNADEYEDTKRRAYKVAEVIEVLKLIWPSVVICLLFILTMIPTHPNITTLVVSEHYGEGNLWNDKYFVPVVTFFYPSLCSLLGRIATSKIKLSKSVAYMGVALMFARLIIFIPLIDLCNALPRNHLPVVFPHDWQYILILGTMSFTGGFAMNLMFLSVPVLASGKEELAFLSMMSLMTIIGTFCSPLGLVIVNIL